MMTLFVKLFIKNKNEVSNPNVKKSICCPVKCCWHPVKFIFVHSQDNRWVF